MTERTKPKMRWWRRWMPAALAAALAVWAIGWFVLRSEWFEEKVRVAVEQTLTERTGYASSIGELDLHIGRLGVEVWKVAMVSPGRPEEPVFTAERAFVSLGFRSFWSQDIFLRSLELDRPVLRLNLADAKPPAAGMPPAAEVIAGLFAITVERLRVLDGALHLDNLEIPISGDGEDFQIASVYEPGEQAYRLALKIGALTLSRPGETVIQASLSSEWLVSPAGLRTDNLTIGVLGLNTTAALQLADYANPRLTGTFHSEGSGVELMDRLAIAWARPNQVAIDGSLAWPTEGGDFDLRAGLAIRDGQIVVGNGQLNNVSLDADVAANRDGFATRRLHIGYRRATAEGHIAMTGFQDPAGPRLDITGDIDGLGLQETLVRVGRLTSADVPANLPWQSALSGWVSVQKEPEQPVSVDLSLIFASPAEAVDAPLTGVVDIALHPETGALDIPRAELRAPGAQMRASGQLNETGESRLNVDLSLHGNSEIRRASAFAGLNADRLFSLNGEARLAGEFQGSLPRRGRAADITFDGHLEATDFDLASEHWESTYIAAVVAPDLLTLRDVRLAGSLGRAAARGTLALTNYMPHDASAVSGQVNVSGVAVERIFQALDREPLAGGRANADVRLQGTIAEPVADAKFRIDEATAYGERFSSFTGEAGYRAGEIELRELLLRRGTGQLAVSGRLGADGRRFQAALRGSGWQLDDLEMLRRQERPWHGTASFDLRGGGEWVSLDAWFTELEGEGTWRIEDLALGNEPLGRFDGAMTSNEGEIELSFATELTVGKLSGSATLSPGANGPIAGSVKAENVDLLKLASLAKVPTAAEAAMFDANVTFGGQLGDLAELTADGTVDRLRVELPELPGSDTRYTLRNPFPLRFRYAERSLRLNSMHVLGDGTDVLIDGTLGFDEQRLVDVDVNGRFNLAVLSGFQPDLIASGDTNVEIALDGSLDDPQLNGRVALADASLRAADFNTGLNGITGELVFQQNRMRVERLIAKSGGGDLSVSGFARVGEEEWNYRFQIDAQHVRVRFPEDVSSVFDGSLTIAGSNLRSLVTGEVLVQRTTLSRDFQIAELIASLSQPTRTPESTPLTRNTRFNVTVTSAPDLVVDTDIASNVDVSVDLRLTGTVASPSLLGRLAFTQGSIDFQGSRYDINRGEISFINPVRIEPFVNIELATRVRDVDVTLNLFGPVTQLNLNYRSDPPLRVDELIGLLTVGKDPTSDPVLAAQQQVASQPLLQAGASAIVSEAISQPFSRGLNRFFGVSRLKVDPQVGGAESNPSARITTEQQLTSELTLTYTYDLSSTQRQVVRLEWNPSRRLTFLVTRDANGLVGADVLYRQRLR